MFTEKILLPVGRPLNLFGKGSLTSARTLGWLVILSTLFLPTAVNLTQNYTAKQPTKLWQRLFPVNWNLTNGHVFLCLITSWLQAASTLTVKTDQALRLFRENCRDYKKNWNIIKPAKEKVVSNQIQVEAHISYKYRYISYIDLVTFYHRFYLYGTSDINQPNGEGTSARKGMTIFVFFLLNE